MKRCFRCGEIKARAEFNRAARNTDGLHSYCRACQSSHYRDNKVRHMRNVRRTARARLAVYRRYLATQLAGGCIDCGNTDIRVLEFDHVRGTKVANVARMVLDASLEKIVAEVSKCEVRCRNCHAIATYERRGGSWRDEYTER